MKKFNQLCNLILEDINSTRKPIRKINAMTPQEFIEFLKQFLPYVKQGKVDLKDVRITQKIDGAAIRMAWIDDDMKFESSYSGVTTWDKLPYPDAGKFLYETYRLIFRDIAEQFGNFKIKGELIWINGMQQNGKVTPVGASYLTQKFGTYGGVVVFEIAKIEGEELVDFPKEDQETIMEMIQDMNNDEFSFFLSRDIILNQNVEFTLDTDQLLTIISGPEFSKQKFDQQKDAKVIQQIKKIQADVVKQLSAIIDKSKGIFSAEGDLIQGIVLKINKSGNQYGIFSNGYKDMKWVYWERFEKVKPLFMQFMKKIFGYALVKSVKAHWNELDKKSIQTNLRLYRKEYVDKMEQLINDIQTSNIPSSVKNTQVSMATRLLNKMKAMTSVEEISKKINQWE